MLDLDAYRAMTDAELSARIAAVKKKLGAKLVILGHYYQRDEVVAFADHEGDSFELSRLASEAKAEHIVFCGVRFMAEAARILSRPEQRVYLPDPDAGCPLADMADIERVEAAWAMLIQLKPFVPVVYMNSSAEVKAFCGRHGGTICTSSSSSRAFEWAMAQNKSVFFLPDENLGRNTAFVGGLNAEEIATWDPGAFSYAEQARGMDEARFVAWKGHCHVHTYFLPQHVQEARQQHPGCVVAVHPECSPEVVALADQNGSTSYLKKLAESAPKGATLVIGTEVTFVNRLAKQHPGKKIIPLARSLCPNMFRTSLSDLCFTLEHLGEVGEVRVRPEVIGEARVALQRMLAF